MPLGLALLGLRYDAEWYIDISIPFSLRWGAMACQRFTNALCYLMEKKNSDCISRIDDLAGAAPSHREAIQAQDTLHGLMDQLGIQRAEHKTVKPCTGMTWISFEFDTNANPDATGKNRQYSAVTTWLARAHVGHTPSAAVAPGAFVSHRPMLPPRQALPLADARNVSGRPGTRVDKLERRLPEGRQLVPEPFILSLSIGQSNRNAWK